VHSKLDAFLLAKKSISNIEPKTFMCTTCYIFIKNNKMPKLALQMVYGLCNKNATKIDNGGRNFNCKVPLLNYIIQIKIYKQSWYDKLTCT